jgi:uncharacterized protein
MAKIQSIYRYPIKGLSPERLDRTALTPGQTIPGDRLYAIENGPSGFDPAKPYLPKTRFLMLMKNERLATLRTAFDQATHVLTISIPSPREAAGRVGENRVSDMSRGGGSSVKEPPTPNPSPPRAGGGENLIRASLRTPEGRAAIEGFFAKFCADELRGPPQILHAEGHSFSDVAKKVVSIINLASVAAVEAMVGVPVNPLRFRANIYVEGWPAWSELDLVGRELTIGPVGRERNAGGAVRLQLVKRIVRCPATNVDPDTGIRDLDIPPTLLRHLDHADCGIYAEVVEGGEITAGDEIQIV